MSALPIQISNVSKTFPNNVAALAPLDLKIDPGEFLAILGPSGCGKSTLLRLIAGLDRPTTGTIGLQRSRSDIAYVFQDAHLLPWRNLLRNVALPLELMHTPKRQRLDIARSALEQVGLADAMTRYPAQLSGGMKMRASLARALVTNPRLLLLDEPFAALDEITRQRLDDLLREIWLTRRITIIFVTHSIQEAAFLARRAIVLTSRPGKMILDHDLNLPEQRPPEIRTDPVFSREMRTLFDALQKGETS